MSRARRPSLLIAAALLLAGAAPEAAWAKRKPKPEPAPPPVQAPAAPARPSAPTLAALMRADETTVKARLGVPQIARKDGAGALWTYRWPSCALLVFFRSADGRGFLVSGADASARRRGQPDLSVDRCLAAASADGFRSDGEGDAIGAILAPADPFAPPPAPAPTPTPESSR
jgi:hypothetical protein